MRILKIFLLSVALFTIGYVLYAQFLNAEHNGNRANNMTSWFEWKIKHLDTQEQIEVIAYFEKINPTFIRANSTVWLPEGSLTKYPDSKKSLELVNGSLSRTREIKPPQICTNHYNFTIDILENVREYLRVRMSLGDEIFEAKIQEDEIFEAKIRNAQIRRLKLEEERQKEYFKILRKVGFYDNMAEEAFKLKLITKEEKVQLEQLKKEDKLDN